jgi:hypothetical protein
MSLVVEDGTGLSTAESYVSVTDADTYHSNRGHTTWTGTDAVKEAALRVATAYIDGTYRRRFVGTKYSAEQALAWPRSGAVDADGWPIDEDVIPQALKDATAEAALRELVTPGSLNPDLSAGGAVESKRVKAGPVETETTYRSNATVGRTTFDLLDQILSSILIGSKYSIPVLRS